MLSENFDSLAVKVRSPGQIKWPKLRKKLILRHSYHIGALSVSVSLFLSLSFFHFSPIPSPTHIRVHLRTNFCFLRISTGERDFKRIPIVWPCQDIFDWYATWPELTSWPWPKVKFRNWPFEVTRCVNQLLLSTKNNANMPVFVSQTIKKVRVKKFLGQKTIWYNFGLWSLTIHHSSILRHWCRKKNSRSILCILRIDSI